MHSVYHAKITVDGRKNVLFLRWRGERYIPKNVFFLREEVLIYDAPESATFPRMFPFVASKYCEATMHPVYHAKITVSTKNFPRSEGRKCGVKGLVQWRGLMVWSRSWFRTTGKGRERVRV